MLTERVLAGRYRLIELLGEGGMALVYRAHDDLLDRGVAVKVLRSGFAADPEFISRFRQEARAAASLHHPNIATVYDTGTDEGADFIVMQLVDGEDLEHILERDGRVPLNVALRIVVDVARALQAAHERGIVHRDIKPANILVDRDGDVRVVDFGIARAADAAVGITTAGVILGSAQYVSPEQVAGGQISPSSDIYSLGVVLYESITGQRPFDGPSPAAVALERLHVRPPPPSAVAHDLPRPSMRSCLGLQRDPGARYPSAGDFAAALESWRLGLLSGVRRGGAGPRDASHPAGHGGGGIATAGAAVSAVATAAVAGGGAVAPRPVRTARVERGAGPPTGRTLRPTARESDRHRRLAPLLLLPVGAFALLAIVTLALLGNLGRDGGGVAGATGMPRSSTLVAVPPFTPEASPTPTPTPEYHTEAGPTPTPTPTPTPIPTPTPTPTPEPTPTRKPTPAPTRKPQVTSRPAPGVPARDPAGTVARFYRLVVEERFDEAAALWTAEMRDRYPPAGNIDGRFAPTTAIDLRRNEIVAFDPDAGSATVAVDIVEDFREWDRHHGASSATGTSSSSTADG